MKIAASLDGKTALENGASQWITGEAARARRPCLARAGGRHPHRHRHRAGRRPPSGRAARPAGQAALRRDRRQPARDAARRRDVRGRPAARGSTPPLADPSRRPLLEGRGADRRRDAGPGGKVDLAAMLRDLAAREVNELHVEAGHKLNGSLLREGLVDELLVYLAPKLMGLGRDMANSALSPSSRRGCRCTCRTCRASDRTSASSPAPSARSGQNRRMFTGIITGVGRIAAVSTSAPPRARQAPDGARRPRATSTSAAGDSIALNGACMTVTEPRRRQAARSPSTSPPNRWTRPPAWRETGPVNLEKALRANDRLGGHIVVGPRRRHRRASPTSRPIGESFELRVLAPAALGKYLAYKGSITVNGVSLTVNTVQGPAGRQRDQHQPHPAYRAEHGAGRTGGRQPVNLEIDTVARYVERMMSAGVQGALPS